MAIPQIRTLNAKVRELEDDYQADRDKFDKNRFLGGWRSKTVNISRQEDINFIQYIAFNIKENKQKLHQFDGDFLKLVIAGALLLSLIDITKTYADEKKVIKRSALGKNILDIFEVQKLSDIPPNEIKANLEALHTYVTSVPVALENKPRSEWHSLKTQGMLLADIESKISECTSALVCS
ncbi:MAG: hypothetical protein Q8M03_07845 [Legionella sp.]|nr:hypothetical protein [Legionella sp.]